LANRQPSGTLDTMAQQHEHGRHRAPPTDMAAAREARAAIAQVAAELAVLHGKVALIAARARHPESGTTRAQLVNECRRVEDAVLAARTELIVRLMDTPPSVAGHSRVVDVEKSLDSLERALAEARSALREH
jgi:hypothetical protein